MHNNNIKISIIIPFYNACNNSERSWFFKKNIESVINQTYKNIEIIYINNNSTDDSQAVVENYAKNDCRIKVINENRQGVSFARNLGIKISTGDYFTFVDSDDYISLDYIESAIKILNKKRYEILIRDFLCEDKNSIFFKSNRSKIFSNFFILLKEIYPYIECTPNIFFKTSFIKKNQIQQNENIKIGEDNLFNIQALFLSKKIGFINQKNYFYRINSTSSSNLISNKYFDFIKAYEIIFSLIIKKYGYINNNCIIYFLKKYEDFLRLVIDKNNFSKMSLEILEKNKSYLKIKENNKQKIKEIFKNIKNDKGENNDERK